MYFYQKLETCSKSTPLQKYHFLFLHNGHQMVTQPTFSRKKLQASYTVVMENSRLDHLGKKDRRKNHKLSSLPLLIHPLGHKKQTALSPRYLHRNKPIKYI